MLQGIARALRVNGQAARGQQRKAADDQEQNAACGITYSLQPDHRGRRDKPAYSLCRLADDASIKNQRGVRSKARRSCLPLRHRIANIGLAALPVKTVIDHDNATVRQRQTRIADDLRFAAGYRLERLVAAGLEL